jgi:hypothetical protein
LNESNAKILVLYKHLSSRNAPPHPKEATFTKTIINKDLFPSQSDSLIGKPNNNENMRFQVLTVASMKFRVFWDAAPCNHIEVVRSFIALMMDEVHTSETSVNFNVTTRPYIPEDSKLNNENLNTEKESS